MFRSTHLREIQMSYGAHMRQAFTVASKMAAGAIVAAIHGIVPDLFTTRAGDIIRELYEDIERMRRDESPR